MNIIDITEQMQAISCHVRAELPVGIIQTISKIDISTSEGELELRAAYLDLQGKHSSFPRLTNDYLVWYLWRESCDYLAGK